MSVYGDHPNKKISEDDKAIPKSFYAIGKLASEQYLKLYSKYNIKISCLRLFNVYGPGQNMFNLKQGMISIFLKHIISEKRLLIKGSLDRYRDFVYIDDAVDSFINALNF